MRYLKVPPEFKAGADKAIADGLRSFCIVVNHTPKSYVNWGVPTGVRITNLPHAVAISSTGRSYKTIEMQWFAWVD